VIGATTSVFLLLLWTKRDETNIEALKVSTTVSGANKTHVLVVIVVIPKKLIVIIVVFIIFHISIGTLFLQPQ
jgi:hypothetical protein